MAQIKLIKLNATTQLPQEMDSAADDITLNSFTVQGGGPVVSATGVDLNNQDVSDVKDLSFNDPTTGTVVGSNANNTIIIDDLMGEAKENSMSIGAAILFPAISDDADEVDAFRLPSTASAPTATPADGLQGYLVWSVGDSSPYVWNGTYWDNLSTSSSIENPYTAGAGGITANDAVYISAANTVLKASASADASAACIGFSKNTAAAAATSYVISEGLLGGFSGLTPASRYYVDTTAGAIVSSPPTGSGNNVVQVGFAKSATHLQIQIQYLGKKA